MNTRWRAAAIYACACYAGATSSPAAAQFPSIFGLQSVVFDPPSGVATAASLIDVDLSGIAPDGNVPNRASVNMLEPDKVEILLTSPAGAAVQVPTSWRTDNPLPFPLSPFIQPPPHFQLAPGRYDFYVRGIKGFGSPGEIDLGSQLVFDDFLVVPEPCSALLTLICMVGLAANARSRVTFAKR